MSAPASTRAQTTADRPTSRSEFDADELAWLAIVPGWTFPLAERAGFGASRSSGSLGLLLDALSHAGLLEVRPTLDPFDWLLTIRPIHAKSGSGRPRPGRDLDELRSNARRIGLLAGEGIGASPSTSSEAEREPASATLRLADVQLRSQGLRFRHSTGFRAGQCVEAVFSREDENGQHSVKRAAVVIATHGNDWSGRSAVVMFDEPETLPNAFPARELFAEFNVAPRMRGTILSSLRQQGFPLARLTLDLARNIDQVAPGDTRSIPLQLWLQLALTAEPEGQAARRLDAELKPLLESGRTAEAEAWLAAAELLAQTVGGALETAVLLGQRRLEWTYRRLIDARMLESFVPRQELFDAFEEILRPEQGPWAVHYLGVGGVGKTMFVRHLTARLADQLPVSRVDFDFLSPDFPVRRPAQLLLELGEGLRGFGGERSDELFLKFQDHVMTLHGLLEATPQAGDELAVLDDGRFGLALDFFCEFVRSLLWEGPRRIDPPRCVVILDTCEELARLRPDGEFSPAVAATFTILERVHERVPQLRAVFAGRRLLSPRGAGWEAKGTVFRAAPAGQRQHQPTPDYLRLQLVRGFTRGEALQLLHPTQSSKRSRPPAPSDEVVAAILEASPESRLAIGIHPDPTPPTLQLKRYNPFQVALYADWVVEEPDLSPATIASGETDPYVEKRILGRLRHPTILAVLPHLVLLRRVDEPLLRRLLAHLDHVAFTNVFRELCQLEWLEYQHAASGDAQAVFLEVERHLRPRIERCLRAARAPDLARARSELDPILRAALLEPDTAHLRSTSRIVVEHLEAALRLLPPNEAATLWAQIEERVCTEAAWSWARQVGERLLAEDEGEFEPHASPPVFALVAPPAIRAHVRATLNAARLRTDAGRVTDSSWREAELDLEASPNGELQEWLELRTKIGSVTAHAAAQNSSEGGTFVQLGEILRRMLDRPADEREPFRGAQTAVAALAAVDAILELAETGASRLLELTEFDALPPFPALPEIFQRAHWLARTRWSRLYPTMAPDGLPGPPPELEASALCARDEWLAYPIIPDTATSLAFETLHELARAGSPADLRELAAAEQERIRPDEPINSPVEAALAALLLQWRLGHGPLAPAEIQRLLETPGAMSPQVPTRVAQRLTPPLFVVAAEALLACGDAQQALALLYQGISRHTDPAAARFAELMRLKIVRRMRLENEAVSLIARMEDSAVPEEFGLGHAVRHLVSVPRRKAAPAASTSPMRDHAVALWRIQELLTPEGRSAALAVGRRLFTAPSASRRDPPAAARDEAAVSAWFTVYQFEHRLLLQEQRAGIELEREFVRLVENSPVPLDRDWRLRLWIAAWQPDGPSLALLRDDVSPRLAADWALEEGELLALRWPMAGARLLEFAVARFVETQDDTFAFIAAVREIIARIHAGETDPAGPRLERLRQIYERLQGRNPALPTPVDGAGRRFDDFWLRQKDAAKNELLPTRAGIFSLPALEDAPADWLPWLKRLRRCLEFHRMAEQEPEKLSVWLQRTESSEQPLEFRLSLRQPGLRDAPAAAGVARPAAPAPAASAPPAAAPKAAKRFAGLRTIGTVAFGLLLLAGLVFSPVFAIWFAIRLLMGDTSALEGMGVTGWIGLTIGVAILVVIFARGVTALRSRLARRSELRLTLRGQQPVSIRLEHAKLFADGGDFWTAPFRAGRRRLVRAPGEWRAAMEGETPAGFSGRAADELVAWSTWLRKHPVGVALDIEGPLADLPWEERLLRSLPAPASRSQQRPMSPWQHYACYRWLPDHRAVSRTPWREARTVFLMSSPRWQGTLERTWATPGLRSLGVLNDWFQIEALPEWPRQVRALHLMGRPITGTGGVALKVDTNREFLERGTSRPPQAVPRREDVFVTAGRRGLERVPLLIVQAEPSAIRELAETDRAETLNLRAFSRELFAGGVAAVLMIPAVQSPLAWTIVGLIRDRVTRAKAARLEEWLALSHAIRDAIAGWRPGASDGSDVRPAASASSPPPEQIAATQRELAFNVTLFARHTFIHLKSSGEDIHHG